jgi:hypothetical protein
MFADSNTSFIKPSTEFNKINRVDSFFLDSNFVTRVQSDYDDDTNSKGSHTPSSINRSTPKNSFSRLV